MMGCSMEFVILNGKIILFLIFLAIFNPCMSFIIKHVIDSNHYILSLIEITVIYIFCG